VFACEVALLMVVSAAAGVVGIMAPPPERSADAPARDVSGAAVAWTSSIEPQSPHSGHRPTHLETE
jgi:hypothetical protein